MDARRPARFDPILATWLVLVTMTLVTPVASAPLGLITPGATRQFQAWHRDVSCGPPPLPCPSPCGMNSNLTNAYEVTFSP